MLLKGRRIAALFWRMPVKRCEQGATIMIEPKRRAQNTARPKRPTGKPRVAALGGYAERPRATRPNRRGKRAAAGVEADETTRHEGPKPTPRGTHVELLQQGVDVWNDWRTKERSISPDLRGADLHKAELFGANLAQADLRGASLIEANLSASSLFQANISEVDLTKANLMQVDLRGACLRKANLSGANLMGASLFFADLKRATLKWANLIEADLRGADLSGADLSNARLFHANLSQATLKRTQLFEADLGGANLSWADLSGAYFMPANPLRVRRSRPNLEDASFYAAKLTEAYLIGADLNGIDLRMADLSRAKLSGASLFGTILDEAQLRKVDLTRADLSGANLVKADLSRANLSRAVLVETNLVGATLTGCNIYGVSAWNVKRSEGTRQLDLIITPYNEPEVTVDDIEVAQLVYLLLHNEKIRDVIDTVGKRGVLLLGRFTEGRIAVLERLREELRRRNYLPIVFNFDKPRTKTLAETVRVLAGLSRFVIADITDPKSVPAELQTTVPQFMVPFLPIIEGKKGGKKNQKPYSLLESLWIECKERVFEPLWYSSLDALVEAFDEKIIKRAEVRFAELLARKAEKMKGEYV